MSGFAISPHEECAVEEAVQITERLGGSVSVLTLGPAGGRRSAARRAGARRPPGRAAGDGGRAWGPAATAAAIVAEARRRAAEGPGYDLLLLGNEAADTGDYQVGVRVAHGLGWPCATGIKHLEVTGDGVRARREYRGREETFEFGLPAVITVKEGINLPRYPSLPGRLRAKRAAIEQLPAAVAARGAAQARAPGAGAAAAAGDGARHRDGRGARPGPAAGRAGGADMTRALPGASWMRRAWSSWTRPG